MLLPKVDLNGFTWDTGRYEAIAAVGSAINYFCVRPKGSGGFESAGDNGNMLMVVYASDSKFAKRVAATPAGQVIELDEGEAEMSVDDDEETEDDEGSNPPNAKRLKTSIGTAGSSTQVSIGLNAKTLSPSIGSGWAQTFNGLKLIPSSMAPQHLIDFYNGVVDQASKLLGNATLLVKQHTFTLGSINLVLAGTDLIYWDWIITFAMAMVDSTSESIAIQYALTMASSWQQNTIKAVLFLGGKGVS